MTMHGLQVTATDMTVKEVTASSRVGWYVYELRLARVGTLKGFRGYPEVSRPRPGAKPIMLQVGKQQHNIDGNNGLKLYRYRRT